MSHGTQRNHDRSGSPSLSGSVNLPIGQERAARVLELALGFADDRSYTDHA
ncbi:hypothetical protein ACWDXV_18200 [Nocardia nova]